MNGVRNKAIRGKKLNKIELAYIAGLVDGEGCINIYRIDTDYSRNKEKRLVPKFVLGVSVCNCYKPIMDWLHECFGGYLMTRNRNDKTWRTNYAIKVSANIAMDFLKQIKPYLKIKKDQAELALKFQENQSRFHKNKKGKPKNSGMSKEDLNFRIDCWKKMKELNHRI